jgi:hypothetical protein
MAPVTGSIADRNKERLVGFDSIFDSISTPFLPPHWIFRMLKKIWRGRFIQIITPE